VIDVAKDVAAVAAVAGAAFTGGSSLVLAAAIIGAAGTVGADVAKRTGLIGERTAMWIELGSAALSGGAGAAQLVGGGGTVLATETSAAVKAASGSTAALATSTEGVATYGKNRALSCETSRQADAALADSKAGEASDRFDDVVDAIGRSNTNFAQAAAIAANLQAADSDLATNLISTIRG
jgi:hypothetical protein